MPSRPKKTTIPHSGKIQKTSLAPPKGLSFSWKYFDTSHDVFNVVRQDTSYLLAFLKRLRNISSLTANEIRTDGTDSLRCHPIDWSQTSHPKGFQLPGEEQLVGQPYQFTISLSYGRVHGFFIGEVFYIVWLDPSHALYPRR